MFALRAPAVRALAVRVRAVRFRAGRVACLCSLHRAALVDVADTTSLVDPGDLTCPFPIISPVCHALFLPICPFSLCCSSLFAPFLACFVSYLLL